MTRNIVKGSSNILHGENGSNDHGNLNSLFCALMCLFAGVWALVVFISVYVSIRVTATLLLRPQITLLNKYPSILNEFVGARIAIACVAMLLGGLSAGITYELPHLSDLSKMIRTVAQASAAFCAIMTASGDVVATYRVENCEEART